MDKDYFVTVYEKGNKSATKEIIHFYTEEQLFDWMKDKKDILFTIYEGKCLIDWS